MKKFLHFFTMVINILCLNTVLNAQCADNLVANGGLEDGMENWWNWHDNNPDAYSFTLSDDAFSGDSSIAINVLVDADSLTSFQGGEYNNRPAVMPVTAGVTYEISFTAKSSVADAMISVWVKDEFDNWTTLLNEFYTVGTEWETFTTQITPMTDRADIHMELKVYSADVHEPYTVLFDEIYLCDATYATETCETNLLTNPGFEAFPSALEDWWTWHGGTEDAYSFYASDDGYHGDSSAVLEVLWPTNDITTGPAEYNNRGMVVPVTGGEFYEVSFAAKSTIDQANVQVWVKDEFDSWATIFNTDFTVGTEWAEYSFIFQADVDRGDIHLELKVYNEGFLPYQVFFDEVAVCPSNPSTITCSDNLITNPGGEEGLTDWWNWHGGDETDYSFESSDEAIVGSGSLLIKVLKPTAEITGTGEMNSRPQVSPVAAGQNYAVSVWAKSSLDGAAIQMWVKDEFDGWTTLANEDATLTMDWAEYRFVFANETDRDDVHLELKVFTDGATAPYDVWFDEISICTTDDDPGSGEPEPEIYTYGALDTLIGCSQSMSFEFAETDIDGDGVGWEVWDGSDDEVLSNWVYDPVLPYSGANSIRVDVTAGNNVAELHHRFADRFDLVEGTEYTVALWARSNVSAGDTLRIYTRPVRDTDWREPAHGNFMVVDNTWKNYSFTFTPDEDFNNAFLDIKAWRWNEADFTEAYTVWYDDIQICSSEDQTVNIGVVSVNDLENLGVGFKLSPNPVFAGELAQLEISAEESLQNTRVRVVDILGKITNEFRIDIQSGIQNITVPTEGLSSGLYFVNIQYEHFTKTIKMQVIEQ